MPIGKKLLAAAFLTAIASAAQAGEYRTFTQDGVTYSYRVIDKGDRQVIVGKSTQLGQTSKFTLRIKNGKVRGDFDGRALAFKTEAARAQNVQLASD
ncbi:MAG: hypothetical protein ACRCY3_13225 [Sphingorhabdus sp.]